MKMTKSLIIPNIPKAFVLTVLILSSVTMNCSNALDQALLKEPRIVNGDRSFPTSRNFYVKSAYDQIGSTADVLCGATLIAPDIIITAAHCQGAFNNGAFILDVQTNSFTRLVAVDHQRRHPGWAIDRTSLNFDVLLLRLSEPLLSTDVAKPIAINHDSYYPSNGEVLKAYGFGLTEFDVVSQNLREADVTYINNDECWGRGIQFNNVMKGEDVLCTDPFGGTTATCLGDSGGPLTDEFGTVLMGVISFGSGCEADNIPDGHVRLSEVSDWVEQQICSLSAVPPAGCTLATTSRDPREVQMKIDFTHDYFPEETTFAVRNKNTLEVVYAGPEYIPKRNGNYESTLYLLPGEYTFEVYDVTGNGLVSGPVENNVYEDGRWTVSALYDDYTKSEVARGDANFSDQQVTKFIVSETISYNSNNNVDVAVEMDACLAKKQIEEDIGALYSTACKCDMNGTLACNDANNQRCHPNHDTCDFDSNCCSGRRCSIGICRSTAPTNSNRGKVGGISIGGAAGRARPRSGNGNLRGL